jgi:SAM-dependent methyltransferase
MTWDEQWTETKTIEKWLKPDEMVVQLAHTLKTQGFKRAFDLGCGVGRHVIFLAREGFEVYASDFSEPAVQYCQEWLCREGLTGSVIQKDMTEIPYPDGLFDLVIAYNVIYHTTFGGMKDLVQTVHRKLRPGGYLFVTLKSTEGWLYGEGVEIEKNTFLRPGKGVPVHFSTEDEIETLFRDFDLVEKNYRSYVARKTEKRHASWKIVLRKNSNTV